MRSEDIGIQSARGSDYGALLRRQSMIVWSRDLCHPGAIGPEKEVRRAFRVWKFGRPFEGRRPGWLQMNTFLASLRASPARYSSLRTIFTTQHPPSPRKTRYYSVIAQGHPSLHLQYPGQPWPGTQHSLSTDTLGNKVVRLDGSPNDAGNSSAGSSTPPSSSSSSGDNPDGSDPPSPPPSDPSSPPISTSISRQSVPENYPQVLALPIARRPLFPGFYKAVVIRNPQVVAAVKEMIKAG